LLPEFDGLLDLCPDAVVVASNSRLQVQHAIQGRRTCDFTCWHHDAPPV
jgi:hypothetical protein